MDENTLKWFAKATLDDLGYPHTPENIQRAAEGNLEDLSLSESEVETSGVDFIEDICEVDFDEDLATYNARANANASFDTF